ncbi:MAG: dTDP-4-dehydrorhamnose 3,5-epimerase [Planctomycetaceae bacterium]
MNISTTLIPDLFVIQPRVFRDNRGEFLETWQQSRFSDAGIDLPFLQDNYSRSRRGTLRGLHYQVQQPQGKLVHVTRGEILDVVVDLRKSSSAFGQHVAITLDDVSHQMLYVPPGCAHGFLTLSEWADVTYKCTSLYAPEHERTLLWSDPTLGIDWPLEEVPLLSEKDRAGRPLTELELFP